MRKKTIKWAAKNIIWILLMALPIIIFMIINLKTEIGNTPIEGATWRFDHIFTGIFNFTDMSVLVQPILNALINSDLIQLGAWEIGLLYYMSWLVQVTIIRLMVEVLLFIPNLAIKWMNAYTKEE